MSPILLLSVIFTLHMFMFFGGLLVCLWVYGLFLTAAKSFSQGLIGTLHAKLRVSQGVHNDTGSCLRVSEGFLSTLCVDLMVSSLFSAPTSEYFRLSLCTVCFLYNNIYCNRPHVRKFFSSLIWKSTRVIQIM